ncbi:MAG TPA: cupin domain-containing protein [Steroidobacteraceae bacterium]|nr:cupin domain-containing protein [Steroidobacteraceae bacterium]
MHGMQLPWIDSPASGVQRKMIERAGGEVALATSIVRYAPGSRFDSHIHERGEEFFVLEGTFSDEHGSYPAGTYVRNPPGSSHAPFSTNGCTIFVKLRQMTKEDTDVVRLLPQEQRWVTRDAGVDHSLLHSSELVQVELIRMKAGSKLAKRTAQRGEEMFVICGNVLCCDTSPVVLTRWSWMRTPGDEHCALICSDDTLLWVKRGHLCEVENKG